MFYLMQKNLKFKVVVVLLTLFLIPVIGNAQFSGGGGSFGGGGSSGGGGFSGGGGMGGMSGKTPYGGRSEEAKYCSCTPGCFKVRTGGPKNAGWKMYCAWGTRLYAHYNIFPNAWQLGLYGQYIECLQIAYPRCTNDGGGYLMIINGTSRGSSG